MDTTNLTYLVSQLQSPNDQQLLDKIEGKVKGDLDEEQKRIVVQYNSGKKHPEFDVQL